MSCSRWIYALDATPFWAGCMLLAGLSLLALLRFYRSVLHARSLEETPTSRIRSAAQGYVELAGTVRMLEGVPIVAPLSGLPCVWYRYSVEQLDRSRDDDRWFGSAGSVERGISSGIFGLHDGTALCVVDPEGAEFIGLEEDCWRGQYRRPGSLPHGSPRLRHLINRGPFRYREARLSAGDALWATGRFRTVADAAPLDQGIEVARVLSAWKKDRRTLLLRFDLNRDGDVDLSEWEHAQRAAEVGLAAGSAVAAPDRDVFVLDRPPNGRPFLLSRQPVTGLARQFQRRAWWWGTLFVLASGSLLASLTIRFSS